MRLIKSLITLLLGLGIVGSVHAATSLPVRGGLAVIDLGTAEHAPKVTIGNNQVLVTRANENSVWEAWLGIGLTQKVSRGKVYFKVNGEQQSIDIEDFDYPEQHLTVKKNQVWPSEEELERIRKESAQMNRVYNSFSDIEIPKEGMIWPIRGPQSSAFGLQRFFNGQKRAPHSGIDIAAPTDTPIQAPAAGKVVLTGHFFFNGKSVFIDHGQGLISMLCHMNDIDVQEGDLVQAGDLIGKVGATGRATGPHLHWTVSLNNGRIEPRLLLAADQPQQPDK